jgi:hypothetical protein
MLAVFFGWWVHVLARLVIVVVLVGWLDLVHAVTKLGRDKTQFKKYCGDQ